MNRRLNIRMTEEHYKQLVELKLAKHLDSDSHAVRWMLLQCVQREQSAIKYSRKAAGYKAQLRRILEGIK